MTIILLTAENKRVNVIIVILTTYANEIKYSQKDTKETDMIYRLHDSNGIQDGKREED